MTSNLLSEPSLVGGVTVNLSTIFLILVVVAIVVLWLTGWIKKTGGATLPNDDPSGKMPAFKLRGLIGYLLLLGLALVFMEISLLSLEFPDKPGLELAELQPVSTPTPQVQQAANQQGATDTTTATPTPSPAPLITDVKTQSIISNSPDMWLAVYGDNFSNKSEIHLNGGLAFTHPRTAKLLLAKFSPAELLSGGLTVQVKDANGSSNIARVTPSAKPKVPLNVFYLGRPYINREMQLLLIILFAGALGSYIHLVKSATTFIGNGTMKGSWFWWYISGPFVGMAMALIFYAVLRGGFLAGTPADENVVNPFGVLAIGALVGMFTDKAALKLAEVFDTLFKSGDARGGKLHAPLITKLEPNKIRVGESKQRTIKVTGERLGKVTVIKFDSKQVNAEVVSDTELTFTLDPAEFAAERTLNISAVDPQTGTSVSAPLEVVAGPNITTAGPLPAATVNTAYAHAMTAADGTPPYKWSITSGPDWLAIDEETGELSGTPVVVGNVEVIIKLEDSNVSDEKTYTLTVN
jgi:hypothetical protein